MSSKVNALVEAGLARKERAHYASRWLKAGRSDWWADEMKRAKYWKHRQRYWASWIISEATNPV